MLRIVCCPILPGRHPLSNPMRGGELSKQFGERLRDLRAAKGLSQEELADLAGLHRTHVSLIERNRRSVRLETLERLARALEVQPADLIPPLRPPSHGGKTRPSSRQNKAR